MVSDRVEGEPGMPVAFATSEGSGSPGGDGNRAWKLHNCESTGSECQFLAHNGISSATLPNCGTFPLRVVEIRKRIRKIENSN